MWASDLESSVGPSRRGGPEGAGHRHEAAVLALSVLLVGIAQHRDLGGIGRLDHVLLGIELLVLLAALELLGRQHLRPLPGAHGRQLTDRKSTRLNSSHVAISYAVFCLTKKHQ